MVRYLALISYTEKGLTEIKDAPKRAAEFRQRVADAGGNMIGVYWATGAFDGCVLFETPDAQTGAAVLLGLGKLGYVRTQSMQIFDESEFKEIVASC
jgi:uncharacterized protein with GYD domain